MITLASREASEVKVCTYPKVVRTGLCFLAAVFLFAVARPTLAQDKADVTTLNDRAIELSKNGMLGKAIEIWVDLLEITDAEYAYRWVFHKNIGRNFQKLSKLSRAWWHFTQARKLAPAKSAGKLEKRIAGLENTLAEEGYQRVEVKANRLGEFLPVDDELPNWYPLPATWWFKPGYAEFKVRSGDGQSVAQREAILAETTRLVAQVPVPREMGRLVIVASPPAAEIRVDDRLLGVGRVETEVEEGDHILSVTLAGYVPFTGSVGVLGDGTEEKSVVLVRVPELNSGQSSFHRWHWLALGSSVALIGGGCGTYWGWGESAAADQRTAHLAWVTAQTEKGQAPSEAEKDADWNKRVDDNVLPAEITSYILWGVGGAGLVATAVWMGVDALGSKDVKEVARLPLIAPLSVSGGQGLVLQISF